MMIGDNAISGADPLEGIPCLARPVPHRCYVEVPPVAEIVRHLTGDKAVVVIGESGIGKSTCATHALLGLANTHYSYRLVYAPAEQETALLLSRIASLDMPLIVLVDETRNRQARMDYDHIRQFLITNRDWLELEGVLCVLSVRSDTYERLSKTALCESIAPYEFVRPHGFTRREAEQYFGELLGQRPSKAHSVLLGAAFECADDQGHLSPLAILALYHRIRALGDPMGNLSGSEIRRIVREYQLLWLEGKFSNDEQHVWKCLRSLWAAGLDSTDILLGLMASEMGVQDPAAVIDEMVNQHLCDRYADPVHGWVYRVHDKYCELFRGSGDTGDTASHLSSPKELLTRHLGDLSEKASEQMKAISHLRPETLRGMLSVYYSLLKTEDHVPGFWESLSRRSYVVPELRGTVSSATLSGLRSAVQTIYWCLMDRLCYERTETHFRDIYMETCGFCDFYGELIKNGLPSDQSMVNILHEPCQFTVRSEFASSKSAVGKQLDHSVKKRLENSAGLYMECARGLRGVLDPFNVGMLWRCAAWDSKFARLNEQAYTCFRKAAASYLCEPAARLLAAECYQAAADISGLPPDMTLEALAKALRLTLALQHDMTFVDWADLARKLGAETEAVAFEKAWAAACHDLREILGPDVVETRQAPTLGELERLKQEMAKKLAECRPNGYVLLLADPNECLVDYVRATLLYKYSLPSKQIAPMVYAHQDRSPQAQDPCDDSAMVVMLGGLKVPGLGPTREFVFPEARMTSLLLRPQESYQGYLWCLPAQKPGGPIRIWAGGSGLEGTYEAAWHLVEDVWGGAQSPMELTTKDGFAVPHIGTGGDDLPAEISAYLRSVANAGTQSHVQQPPASNDESRAALEPGTACDFASFPWYGTIHKFTPTQAACVRVMYEAYKEGSPCLRQETILERARSTGKHLKDIFRRPGKKGRPGTYHPAWGTIIVQAQKGAYGLRPPKD